MADASLNHHFQFYKSSR